MYSEEKLRALREAICITKTSTDDRLVRMAYLLEDALNQLNNNSGKIRLFKITIGISKVRYYESEKAFRTWMKRHNKSYGSYCKVTGYEFLHGEWIEV